MDLNLKGSVGVVVGAARGLGQTIAAALVDEGAQVALLDVSPEVSRTADELGQRGVAQAWVADVTNFADVERVAAEVRARFGRIDHVFFAVAIGSGKFGFPFWSFKPDVWDRVLRVNLVGAAHVAHAFAPAMAEARQGTFLVCVVGGWPDRLADRSAVQCLESGVDQLCPMRGQRSGSLRRAGEHALPGHGANGAQPGRVAIVGRSAAR